MKALYAAWFAAVLVLAGCGGGGGGERLGVSGPAMEPEALPQPTPQVPPTEPPPMDPTPAPAPEPPPAPEPEPTPSVAVPEPPDPLLLQDAASAAAKAEPRRGSLHMSSVPGPNAPIRVTDFRATGERDRGWWEHVSEEHYHWDAVYQVDLDGDGEPDRTLSGHDDSWEGAAMNVCPDPATSAEGTCHGKVGDPESLLLSVSRSWVREGHYALGMPRYEVEHGTWHDRESGHIGVYLAGASIDDPRPVEGSVLGHTSGWASGLAISKDGEVAEARAPVDMTIELAGEDRSIRVVLGRKESLGGEGITLTRTSALNEFLASQGYTSWWLAEDFYSGLSNHEGFVYVERFGGPNGRLFGVGDGQRDQENDVVSGNGRGQLAGVLTTFPATTVERPDGSRERTDPYNHPVIFGTVGLTDIEGHEGLSLLMTFGSGYYRPFERPVPHAFGEEREGRGYEQGGRIRSNRFEVIYEGCVPGSSGPNYCRAEHRRNVRLSDAVIAEDLSKALGKDTLRSGAFARATSAGEVGPAVWADLTSAEQAVVDDLSQARGELRVSDESLNDRYNPERNFLRFWSRGPLVLDPEGTQTTIRVEDLATGPKGAENSGYRVLVLGRGSAAEHFAYAWGDPTGANPTRDTEPASTGRWRGGMHGAHAGNLLSGKAVLVYHFWDSGAGRNLGDTLEATMTGIKEHHTGRKHADLVWEPLPVSTGVFTDGQTIHGSFYGTGAELAGGVFHKRGITGAFRAERDEANE